MFVDAVKAGHSYATLGPLIYPDTLFGTEIEHAGDRELELNFVIESVNGLKSAHLIQEGRIAQVEHFGNAVSSTKLSFAINPNTDSWFSLVVEDEQGKRAFTNPVWVSIKK